MVTASGHSNRTAPNPSEPSAQSVVESFFSSLGRLDFDAALALIDDEARWVNHPVTTARNKRQFDKALRAMFRDAERFEVRYFDIHERSGGIVYTDRVDVFEGGGLSLTLRVRGEFRVRQGRITEWVDRFSWLDVVAAIAKSLPSIVRRRLGR